MTPELIWIEELVDIAERSASAPVYPLLKRADERHVTMQAYDNPVFVEDMVRNVARDCCGRCVSLVPCPRSEPREHPQPRCLRPDRVDARLGAQI